MEKDDPVLHLLQYSGEKVISISPVFDNKVKATFIFTSSDAGSGSFNIKLSSVTQDSLNNFFYSGNMNPFEFKNQVSKDAHIESAFYILNPRFTQIFFWVRGKYKNIDKTKEYAIDDVYFYKTTDKGYGLASADDNRLIKSIVSKNEK